MQANITITSPDVDEFKAEMQMEIDILKAKYSLQYLLKWLTDITEFSIPGGTMYLTPIVDCFDGLLVAWETGLSSDSNLVNNMLDEAINHQAPDEKPIAHSGRGGHPH